MAESLNPTNSPKCVQYSERKNNPADYIFCRLWLQYWSFQCPFPLKISTKKTVHLQNERQGSKHKWHKWFCWQLFLLGNIWAVQLPRLIDALACCIHSPLLLRHSLHCTMHVQQTWDNVHIAFMFCIGVFAFLLLHLCFIYVQGMGQCALSNAHCAHWCICLFAASFVFFICISYTWFCFCIVCVMLLFLYLLHHTPAITYTSHPLKMCSYFTNCTLKMYFTNCTLKMYFTNCTLKIYPYFTNWSSYDLCLVLATAVYRQLPQCVTTYSGSNTNSILQYIYLWLDLTQFDHINFFPEMLMGKRIPGW